MQWFSHGLYHLALEKQFNETGSCNAAEVGLWGGGERQAAVPHASALCSSSRPPVDHQPTCFTRLQAFAAASNITMEGMVELIGMTALEAVSGLGPEWLPAAISDEAPPGLCALCSPWMPTLRTACVPNWLLPCLRLLCRRATKPGSRSKVCLLHRMGSEGLFAVLNSIIGDSSQAQAVKEARLGMGSAGGSSKQGHLFSGGGGGGKKHAAKVSRVTGLLR